MGHIALASADVWGQILQFQPVSTAIRMSRTNRLLHGIVEAEVLSKPERLIQVCRYAMWPSIELVHPLDPAYSAHGVVLELSHELCADLGAVLRAVFHSDLLNSRGHAVGHMADASPVAATALQRVLPHLPGAHRRRMAAVAQLTARSLVPLRCIAHAYAEEEAPELWTHLPSASVTHKSHVLLIGHLPLADRETEATSSNSAQPGTLQHRDTDLGDMDRCTPDRDVPSPGDPSGGLGRGCLGVRASSRPPNALHDVQSLLTGATTAPESFPEVKAGGDWYKFAEELQGLAAAAGSDAQLVAVRLSTYLEFTHCDARRCRQARREDEGDGGPEDRYDCDLSMADEAVEKEIARKYVTGLYIQSAMLPPADRVYKPRVDAPGYWMTQHRVPTHRLTRHGQLCQVNTCTLGRLCRYAHHEAELNQDFYAWELDLFRPERSRRLELMAEARHGYRTLFKEVQGVCPRRVCWLCHGLQKDSVLQL